MVLRWAIVTHKVGQTDLVFCVHQGLLVDLFVQEYPSLSAAVTICVTLINIYPESGHTHTHTHTHTQTDRQTVI